MKNKQIAIEAIKSDCIIKRRYIDCDGHTCAIGGLCKAANISLMAWNHMNVSRFIISLESLLIPLSKFYGLTSTELQYIQDINDEIDNLEERRAKIIEYIEAIP